jgi:LacI family transcriptional regulator
MNVGRQMTRVTVQDVARQAGVHSSTVSRALNPETRHRLTKEVVERILAVSKDLGYVPNGAAAMLRTQRSKIIGVILPDMTNPVFPPILDGIDHVLDEAEYVAMVANTGKTADHEHLVVERFLGRQVDGLLLAAFSDDHTIEMCAKRRVPVIMLNRGDQRQRVSSIVSDNRLGLSIAVNHLVSLGHRRIGYISGPTGVSTGKLRLEGFKAEMARHGLDADAVAMASAFTREAALNPARALLDRFRDLTAVVAANDLLALGLYDELKSRGLRCPSDISVVGHNDMLFADVLMPPLTTVRIRHREMGEHAARMLLHRIRDNLESIVDIVLKPELVVRESTAAPRV